jgi:formate dehydrogenase subunit gamma
LAHSAHDHGTGIHGTWDQAVAAAVIAAHAARPGAMLPILHALQHAFGHVPRQSHAMIAAVLNLSRAEVHGVVSFYHDFRAAPAGGLSGDGRRGARRSAAAP